MVPLNQSGRGAGKRDRILQVRIPPDLKDLIEAFLAHLRETDPRATESQAVRQLLRAALAPVGLGAATADPGFNEGLRRGYSEARAALRETFEKFFPKEKKS
ncbi:MAG TPA: hypothetical protein VHO06_20090 [Polyangia bacterium]|nr:hypothetical protein [Polyangia bacterium]